MALINYNTRVQFEYGAISLLGDEIATWNVRRPLIVTDAGIAATGIMDAVTGSLPEAAAAHAFTDCPANPTEAAVEAAAAFYREQECDGIIGVGGGSPMDLAKALSVRVTNDPPLSRFAFYKMGMAFKGNPPVPLFLVPTTAGTGSEVSRGGVIIFESRRKALLFLPPGSIRAAIVDPELTLGLPPGLTAATGLDAVSHCVETFCSPTVNPPADAIAMDGLGRLLANIETAVGNGGDRDARWHMMLGAMEGALAFQKGMGAVHALSHPLGALHLHHGTLNAVLMPHVLAYNADHLGEKFARMRRVIGLPETADIPEYFARLNERLGLPISLSAMGVPEASLNGIAEEAPLDSSHPTNPRPMGRTDYLRVLQSAWA